METMPSTALSTAVSATRLTRWTATLVLRALSIALKLVGRDATEKVDVFDG